MSSRLRTLLSQSLSSELSTASGQLVAMKCDVRKEEDITAVFEAAKTKFGGVDVCIPNAGLSHKAGFLTGATGDWRDMTEVRNDSYVSKLFLCHAS